MIGKWLSMIVLVATAGVLLSVTSCGHSQELVAIQVQPNSETFGASYIPVIENAGSKVQLTALGSYIHPPVTKDITDQVTWASSDTQMFTITSGGMLTATGETCGTTLVSASLVTNSSAGGISSSGAVVTGNMTANVVCFSGSGTGSGPAVAVTFAGSGSGLVSSMPPGLSCASSAQVCAATFTAGTSVTLTATPIAPSTSASWAGCPVSTSTNVCSFPLETNTFVTATFN